MLLKILLELTISTSFAFSLYPEALPLRTPPVDAYPSRTALTHLAERICSGLKNDISYMQNGLPLDISSALNRQTSNLKIEGLGTINRVFPLPAPQGVRPEGPPDWAWTANLMIQ